MVEPTQFDEFAAVADHMMTYGGRLVISFQFGRANGATVGYEFGREADDSDMAGGASYGIGATVDEAMIAMAEALGIR